MLLFEKWALTILKKTQTTIGGKNIFQLGLSISYDRLMDISNALGNRVFYQCSRERCVCPPNLRKKLFTKAAVDKIDHNPSSTTGMDFFYGTSIYLFQHPNKDSIVVTGTDQLELCPLDQLATKQMLGLPESYTRVTPLMYSESPMFYFWYMPLQI